VAVSERKVSAAVAGLGIVLLTVLAALLVPWHPVPGGAVTPVPAHDVFSAAQIDRAEAFARQARILSWSSLGVSLLAASVLGFTSIGPSLMDRLTGPWWLRVGTGTGLVLVIGRLVTLPFALRLRGVLLDYGLTNQSQRGWLRDTAVSFGLGWLVTALVMLVLVGCARRWERAWPAVAGAVLAALVMAGSFVYPVLVEPLFNHFEPLPDGPLRASILKLADQEDVHIDDVLVSDASRRTTTLNAYVSGYGDTRRVVVYDNLVNDLPQAESLSVVAHELAHARHNDPLVGSVLGAVGTFVAIGLLGLVVGLVRRREENEGSRLSEVAAVPLVLALSTWGMLLGSPIENAVSRQIETRADVDALRTTQDPEAFIAVQKQLAVRGLSDPTPPAWSQFWFGSHPTVLARVAIAQQLGR
jgi:STE24 endopeptidase